MRYWFFAIALIFILTTSIIYMIACIIFTRKKMLPTIIIILFKMLANLSYSSIKYHHLYISRIFSMRIRFNFFWFFFFFCITSSMLAAQKLCIKLNFQFFFHFFRFHTSVFTLFPPFLYYTTLRAFLQYPLTLEFH